MSCAACGDVYIIIISASLSLRVSLCVTARIKSVAPEAPKGLIRT